MPSENITLSLVYISFHKEEQELTDNNINTYLYVSLASQELKGFMGNPNYNYTETKK